MILKPLVPRNSPKEIASTPLGASNALNKGREIPWWGSRVAANRELIECFEKKILATLTRVWGEDEPVPAEE